MKKIRSFFSEWGLTKPSMQSWAVGRGRSVASLPERYYAWQHQLTINRGWFLFGHIPFLMIPKCACTSIKMAFASKAAPEIFHDPANAMRVHGLYAPHGGTFVRWENRSEIKSELQHSFCVVRDPVERFLSFYRDKIVGAQKNGQKVLHPDLTRAGFVVSMTLEDSVDHLRSSQPADWDQHTVPQYLFVHQSAGARVEPAARYILRFGSLAEDWRKLASFVPELPELPETRYNLSQHSDCERVSVAVEAGLREFYAADFQLLEQIS